ncbi:MAG: aconitase family protein, partial [Bacillota bacterium]
MGKTAVEKILARCAGKDEVKAGDVVWAKPDLVTMPDASILNPLSEMKSLGLEMPHDPDRIVVVSDHRVFLNSDRDAGIVKRIREEVCKPGFCRFFDVGRHGLTHQLPVEKGFALPGAFIASLDTQATTLGGIGAFAVPVNADIIFVLATGSVWMRVPQTVRLVLNGKTAPGVDARDVILYLLRKIGWEAANYRALEFLGPVVESMSVDERMTLCNGVVQIGAKAGFVAADGVTLDYFEGRTAKPLSPIVSDPDAVFERVLEFDVSRLEPQIAVPPAPDNSTEVRRCAVKKVDWAFIAGCASARMHDLR